MTMVIYLFVSFFLLPHDGRHGDVDSSLASFLLVLPLRFLARIYLLNIFNISDRLISALK